MAPIVSIPSDAILSAGSLILVTGVNGYVGAHVADQLLKRGFRVRGVVRRPSNLLITIFDERYGEGEFDLYQVDDVADEALLGPAMEGVSGVIHLASDLSFSPDPTIVIPIAVSLAMSALQASASNPEIKRFIFTSSAMAASPYKPNVPKVVTKNDYADEYIKEVSEPGPYAEERKASTYGASKALAEKEVWERARDHEGETNLVVNTVLPACNLGVPISPEYQGWPSSAATIKSLFEGNVTTGFHGRMLPPQNFVAVQDTALLHLAALLNPTVRNERVFAYAEPKNANRCLEIFRDLYPDRQFVDDDPNEGVDMTEVIEKPRAEELLRWISGRGWISLRESLKEMGDYLISH